MKKTVLITGSSRGIGRACAELFAENDYNVIINYVHSEKEAFSLLQLLKDRGQSAIAIKADAADYAQVQTLFAESIKQFGKIDVLVNNAGIAEQKLFIDMTENDWDNMMNVNLKGVFNCCKFAVPDMLSRQEGKIINISSIWGITGASCEVHYSTAKAGIIGFTKALAKELGPSNIQVNCVAPGVIETDMNACIMDADKKELINCTPLQRMGKPQEIAESILFLASDKANFITGQVLSPNGGFVI